jgi:hypothetical protein
MSAPPPHWAVAVQPLPARASWPLVFVKFGVTSVPLQGLLEQAFALELSTADVPLVLLKFQAPTRPTLVVGVSPLAQTAVQVMCVQFAIMPAFLTLEV